MRNTAASLVLIAGVTFGAYYIYENQPTEVRILLSKLGLGEDPQLQVAWSQAQSLHQDPNQSLATIAAAYQRVLDIDADHGGAIGAVESLASEWRTNIEEALIQGNLQAADSKIQEARVVFPNDVEWINFTTRLRDRQRADRIMASTQVLLTSHGLSDLPSATAAIQAYQEVLRLAPEHEAAARALDELALHYVGLANSAASQGQVPEAIGLLERATAANNSLPAAR